MYKRHKYDIIVILAVVGFGVSVYLAVSHYLGIAVPCDITGGCEVVLNSKYSSFLGLPLSVWGSAYFFGVIISALMANHYPNWRKLLTFLLGFGALSSLVLLGIQFFVLKKVCQYCLVVDVLNIILFILDINIEHKSENNPL